MPATVNNLAGGSKSYDLQDFSQSAMLLPPFNTQPKGVHVGIRVKDAAKGTVQTCKRPGDVKVAITNVLNSREVCDAKPAGT